MSHFIHAYEQTLVHSYLKNQPPSIPVSPFLSISIYMRNEMQAIQLIPHSSESEARFVVHLPFQEFGLIDFICIFELSGDDVRVKVLPTSIKSVGISLRLSSHSQRLSVDVYQMLHTYNKLRDSIFSYAVDEGQHICLRTLFFKSYLSNFHKTRLALNSIFQELKKNFMRIMKFVEPYLLLQGLTHRETSDKTNIYQKQDVFTQKARGMVFLSQFYQERRKYLINHPNQILSDYQINGNIVSSLQKFKNQMLSKSVAIIPIINPKIKESNQGRTAKFVQNLKSIRFQYEEMLKSYKRAPKEVKPKNVHGFQILKTLKKEHSFQSLTCSHSQLSIGKFRLIIYSSLNSQVQREIQQEIEKRKLENISKVQMQLQLVKKICRDPQKYQSYLSFRNEVDFIYHIRQRTCEHVSTYYWQMKKNKRDINSIYMDYYPTTLHSMLAEGAEKIALVHRLEILIDILEGITWLSDNYVCHRDLKPANIVLTHDKKPKILDFGSCCTHHGRKEFTVSSSRLLGTKGYYFSYRDLPQEFKSKTNSKSIFARSSEEYEQHPLFDAYSFGRIMEDVLEIDIKKEEFQKILPNLGNILQYICGKAMQMLPQDRLTYQQMLFFLKRIKQFVGKVYQKL